MCKSHLDLLALTSRCLEALGASERPGNVPGMLMDVARDLARWFFRTALRFEWASIAVELAPGLTPNSIQQKYAHPKDNLDLRSLVVVHLVLQ